MAYSQIQLCNLALKRIGVKRTIIALSDQSQEAAACNLTYTHSRDSVLDGFPWPFAMKYLTLNLVEDFTSSTTVHDWGYSYRYPNDCLKLRRLVTFRGRQEAGSAHWNDWNIPVDQFPAAYELGNDAQGLLIYTDEVDAVAQYTNKFTDPAFFSPVFADALIWRLAADLAMPLSIDDKIRAQCENMFMGALAKAQVAERNQRQLDAPPDSEFIRSRS